MKVRTNHFRNLLGWTGAILLMGSMASTADAKGNIKCMVVDENGKPIEKSEMILTQMNNARERRRKTNDKGEIEFKGLDDGAYRIRGNVEGYVFSNSLPMDVAGKDLPCNHTLVTQAYANKLLQGTLTLLQQKKVAEAEENAKKAVELMPDESGSHYVLSVAYASAGKDAEAAASIEKAAELDPAKYKDKVKTVQMMAMGVQADQLMRKSDFEGAIQKYHEMAEVDPSEALTYFNLAVAYGRQNKINDAITAIDKALALKPGDAEMMQTKKLLEDRFMQSLDQELKAP